MERPMRYAYEVYRQKSFSRAAEVLYVSQPALSAIIRKLEDSLETPLFDRSTKPVSLTPAGEYYISCAEQIMAVETGMKQYFEDVLALRTGSIRIGASTYFCSNLLPGMLHAFHELYPDIAVSVEENNSTPALREHLTSKEIDFAVTSNTYPENDYEAISLKQEYIILWVPRENPVNGRLGQHHYTYDEILQMLDRGICFDEIENRTPIEAFAGEKFITIDKISDLYPRILNMFREHNLTPEIVMHLQQMSSCYYMAANGFGSAFLRSSTLQTVRDTNSLFFYFLDTPYATRNSRLYYKKGVYVSRAMQAFMDWVSSDGNRNCWQTVSGCAGQNGDCGQTDG